MGFADLSIADIAADYGVPVEKVLSVCDKLLIVYKNQKTRLALEDAKAIISQILADKDLRGIDWTCLVKLKSLKWLAAYCSWSGKQLTQLRLSSAVVAVLRIENY